VYPQVIQQLIDEEHLPDSYGKDASRWFLPLVDELRDSIEQSGKAPLFLGINGAQGTGKSTLGKLIKLCLESNGYSIVVLSIDDFYLGKAARIELAARQHPLLATRGVPGTHNTNRLGDVMRRLREGELKEPLVLPAFNKASDDSVGEADCPRFTQQANLVILEGWFVGAGAQAEAALVEPINELEAQEDQNGDWRRYVNKRLAEDYVPIFDMLDRLILLQAPSFEMVYEWRGLQEDKLRNLGGGDSAGVMNSAQLQRFIQHYERLTRHCLATLPAQADTVFTLDENHRVTGRRG